MWEDPYPLQIEGGFAAQKDSNAREFDTDGMQEFDAYSYYDLLDPWTWEHTRSHESGGSVLSNNYFELKDGLIELSWDNRGRDPPLYTFDCGPGGTRVNAEVFKADVLKFVDTYERHWGIKVNDDSTWMRMPTPGKMD